MILTVHNDRLVLDNEMNAKIRQERRRLSGWPMIIQRMRFSRFPISLFGYCHLNPHSLLQLQHAQIIYQGGTTNRIEKKMRKNKGNVNMQPY